MSPLRALATARLQVLWNTACRGSGPAGVLAAAVLLLVAAACLVPPFGMFVVFGRELGGDLAAPEGPAFGWLASLQAIVVLGLGTVGGIRSHGAFDRELLRMLPMRRLQVVLAELPFLLLDTIPVLGFCFLGGLGVGLASQLPEHRLAIALVTAQGMLSLLLVQHLVGTLRRLAGRRSFRALIGFGLLLLGLALASQFALRDDPGRLLELLPTSLGWQAVRQAALEQPSAAALLHAGSLLWCGVLFALAAWLHLRELEKDPPLRRVAARRERLWSFRTPAAGIARLFIAQVSGSRFGRLLLILPAFATGAFVLASVIVGNSVAGRESDSGLATLQALLGRFEALPLWFLIPVAVACLDGELWLNQFAWDGKGIKTLILAPLRTEDLLWGKLLGLLGLLVPQGLLACLPLLRLSLPDPLEVLAGLAAAAVAVVLLGGFGHLLSAWYPRRQRGEGEGSTSAPPQLGLLATLAILAVAGLVVGLQRLLSGLPDWTLPAAFLSLTALLLAAHRLVAGELARQVDRHVETVVETLS